MVCSPLLFPLCSRNLCKSSTHVFSFCCRCFFFQRLFTEMVRWVVFFLFIWGLISKVRDGAGLMIKLSVCLVYSLKHRRCINIVKVSYFWTGIVRGASLFIIQFLKLLSCKRRCFYRNPPIIVLFHWKLNNLNLLNLIHRINKNSPYHKIMEELPQAVKSK